MPRSPQQYEQIRSATNEKILSAAKTMFSKRGFGATGMQDIARLAGISAGLVYRHYASKERLFEAVLDMIPATLDEVLRDLENAHSVRDFFITFTQHITSSSEVNAEMGEFYPLIYQSQFIPGLEARAKAMIDENDRFMRGVAEYIKVGQLCGEIKPGDPLALAQHFFAGLQGTALLRLILGSAYAPVPANLLTDGLLEDNDYE